MFNLHGARGNMICPTLYSLRAQGARAGATLDYWQGTLNKKEDPLRVQGQELGHIVGG